MFSCSSCGTIRKLKVQIVIAWEWEPPASKNLSSTVGREINWEVAKLPSLYGGCPTTGATRREKKRRQNSSSRHEKQCEADGEIPTTTGWNKKEQPVIGGKTPGQYAKTRPRLASRDQRRVRAGEQTKNGKIMRRNLELIRDRSGSMTPCLRG